MLKKILLVLLILAPSALYLYLVSGDSSDTPKTEQVATPEENTQNSYQTPDH